MTTKSYGFSLIELLVVVAILGIISAIGVVSYSGYVESSKRKSAENIMMQISLAQSEYYSDNDNYYYTTGCKINNTTESSDEIEKHLLGDADVIVEKTGYEFCVENFSGGYKIKTREQDTKEPCTMEYTDKAVLTKHSSRC